jgi:ATP-dependent helicase YprA (DUF1998 family)
MFLGLIDEQSLQEPLSVSKRKDREQDDNDQCLGTDGSVSSKRLKVLHITEQPALKDKAEDDGHILQALQVALRDDNAQFRSAEQEEAVRSAAAKETPLVVILPTGGGKSCVFMVPALLP